MKLNKTRCMLQWSRNVYGFHHVSLWALNDAGEGCWEYGTGIGVNKMTAFLDLARRVRRQYGLRPLLGIRKQEIEFTRPGKVYHFRVQQLDENSYVIQQRHRKLFKTYWDAEAELIRPNCYIDAEYKAQDIISDKARANGFDFRIHH